MSFMSRIKLGSVPTDIDRITDVFNGYLSPHYKRQLFDTHDIDHALKSGPGFEQVRAYNTLLYRNIAQSMKGKRGVYYAGSISKGMLANFLALMEGPFRTRVSDGSIILANHVYDMDETIGSQRVHQDILAQNKRKQIQNNLFLRTLFRGLKVLIPSALQGAVGVAGTAEFDRSHKRRDKDYMQVWTAVIRELCCIFPVMDDWFFSGATQGLEYPARFGISRSGVYRSRPARCAARCRYVVCRPQWRLGFAIRDNTPPCGISDLGSRSR